MLELLLKEYSPLPTPGAAMNVEEQTVQFAIKEMKLYKTVA
jgi:hypothetical protein